MCPRSYVFQYDSLEITAGDTIVVDEYVVAMLGKVLENCQPPWLVGTVSRDNLDENG